MKVRTIPNYPRPEVKAFGDLDSVAITYAAMRTKELELK